MSPEPLLRRLAQVAVNVQDVERATAFYRDKLGLRHLFSAGALAFFDIGGTRLMLSRAEQPEFDHPASILYYDVADIGEAHRTLAGRGVRFENEPHLLARLATTDLWMAEFRDSEGNAQALQSEVPRKP
ncbi:MAG TPA: VOC family protein [Dongiaceae bacterium]|nr:VOC family protein [Dongiaceae bacterium]